MRSTLNNHPCFSATAAKSIGRMHLAIAPDCNIQCNYCNRRYSCVNESRPGVTAAILKPAAVHNYVTEQLRLEPRIRIIGIAGPGDPLASAATTIAVLRQVKSVFPHLSLCLSTNGLTLSDHLAELNEIGLEYLTITINAIDPEIGRLIYSRVSYKGEIFRERAAAQLLWSRQLMALEQLRKFPITVKINTVVIPNINDNHVETIAREMTRYKIDVMNCLPMLPVADTPFADLKEIPASEMKKIRQKTEIWLPQIRHCRRCRADASGLLHESCITKVNRISTFCKSQPHNSKTLDKRIQNRLDAKAI